MIMSVVKNVLDCNYLKYQPIFEQTDYCLVNSSEMDFENRVYNVFDVPKTPLNVSKDVVIKFPASFIFQNANISNLNIYVNCQSQAGKQRVAILDLGGNILQNISVSGQCTGPQPFSFLLQSKLPNTERSIWVNVTTDGSELNYTQLEYRGRLLPFYYSDYGRMLREQHKVETLFDNMRYYVNETLVREAQYEERGGELIVCTYPGLLIDGECFARAEGELERRASLFNERSYTADFGVFYTLQRQNLTLFRCKQNYVIYHAQCVPQCPAPMLNQSGRCQWFCDENFVLYRGVCLSTCPQWLTRVGDVCQQADYNPKWVLQCMHSELFVNIETIADVGSFIEEHPNMRHCYSYFVNAYVYSKDIAGICIPPFVWAHDACREQCQTGELLHVESNSCRNADQCKIIHQNLCLDLCPPDYIENNRACVRMYNKNAHQNYQTRDFFAISRNVNKINFTCTNFYELNDCVDSCSPNYYLLEANRTCLTHCPNYVDVETQKCVSKCSPLQYSYGRQCSTDCPQGLKKNNQTMECLQNCKGMLTENDYCVLKCSSNKVNYSSDCVDQCPPYMFQDLQYKICVAQCPFGTMIVGDFFCIELGTFYYNFFNPYVVNCIEGFYDQLSTHTCVHECDEDEVIYKQFCTVMCLDYFIYKKKCYETCPKPLINDKGSGTCLEQCGEYMQFDTNTNSCIKPCDQLQFIVSNGSCVDQCPPPLFGDVDSRYCVSECNAFIDAELMLCMSQCQPPKYGDLFTHFCVRQCGDDTVADPENKMCSRKCPDNYLTDRINHQCVHKCPNNLLQAGKSCVRWCDDLYADYELGYCVKSCKGIVHAGVCYDGLRKDSKINEKNQLFIQLWNSLLIIFFVAGILITFIK